MIGIQDQAAALFRTQGIGFHLDQSFLRDLFGFFRQIQLFDPFPAHCSAAFIKGAGLTVAICHSGCRDDGIYKDISNVQPGTQGAGKEFFVFVHNEVRHGLANAFVRKHVAVYLGKQFHFFGERDLEGISFVRSFVSSDIATFGGQTQLFVSIYCSGEFSDVKGFFHRRQYRFIVVNIVVRKAPSAVFEYPDAIAVHYLCIRVFKAEITHQDALICAALNADVGVFCA